MDSSEVEALLTTQSLALLGELDSPSSADAVMAMVTQLRKEGHPPERVRAVMNQIKLRPLARAKFGDFADSMLFTPEGLEQATRLDVASHHAGRYLEAGIRSVVDCGCGIGGDALAFAGIGLAVRALEANPQTAALAAYNLAAFDKVIVEIGDVTHTDISSAESLWIDPARRSGARRTYNPLDWYPSLEWSFAQATERPTGIKLGPGLDRDLIPEGHEAQWVSHHGTVVELVLWSGQLARKNVGRSALVMNSRGSAEIQAPADSLDQPVDEIKKYVYEPDGAVIRARLIGDLARTYNAQMIDSTIAYFSSDECHSGPLAQGFTVREVVPYSTKNVISLVRAANLGEIEIKKRGIDIDPQELRKTLPLAGKHRATLFLTRAAGTKVAILADRLD